MKVPVNRFGVLLPGDGLHRHRLVLSFVRQKGFFALLGGAKKRVFDGSFGNRQYRRDFADFVAVKMAQSEDRTLRAGSLRTRRLTWRQKVAFFRCAIGLRLLDESAIQPLWVPTAGLHPATRNGVFFAAEDGQIAVLIAVRKARC